MKVLLFCFAFQCIAVTAAASPYIDRLKDRYVIGPRVNATITAYTDDPRENGVRPGQPVRTAIGSKVRPGVVAVSRDLLKNGWKYGSKVYIEGMGVFTIEDTMHRRWSKRFDVAVNTKKEAFSIGKRKNRLVLLLRERKS